jgi:pimeloyl-ACP methyl ester carboxylesterase
VGWSTRLLYLIWFFSTGIFGGYFPESLAIKYLVPTTPTSTLAGYSAPFPQPRLKTSITRFAHIVPFLPDFVLENWRNSHWWKVLEGLIGPARFTNLNAQAGLAERNEVVREYWRNGVSGRFEGTGQERLQTIVAFGQNDPLSGDFKEILVRGISDEVQKIPKGVWIDGAGHYPMVEKPAVVAQLIGLLVG